MNHYDVEDMSHYTTDEDDQKGQKQIKECLIEKTASPPQMENSSQHSCYDMPPGPSKSSFQLCVHSVREESKPCVNTSLDVSTSEAVSKRLNSSVLYRGSSIVDDSDYTDEDSLGAWQSICARDPRKKPTHMRRFRRKMQQRQLHCQGNYSTDVSKWWKPT